MPPVTTIAPSYQEDGVVIYHDDFARVLPMLPAGSVDFVLDRTAR